MQSLESAPKPKHRERESWYRITRLLSLLISVGSEPEMLFWWAKLPAQAESAPLPLFIAMLCLAATSTR